MTDELSRDCFHKILDAEKLDALGRDYALEAADSDLACLAKFLNVPAVNALSGEVCLSKHGPNVQAKGSVRGTLQRECVATLEPLIEEISESFSANFTLKMPPVTKAVEVEADLNAPEPIIDGMLDVGDVLLEQLVLAMASHPRREGVDALVDPGAGATISPFAALGALKKKD